MSVSAASRLSLLADRLVYLVDLTREMVIRDVRIKYERSVFGIVWAMLNPLLHLSVFYFVFQVVLEMNTPRFTAFGLIGLLVWGWSAGALSHAAGSITGNRSLLHQPGFPAAVLPPVAAGANLVYFLFALPVLTIFLLLDGSRPGWSLLALPAVIAVQFLLTLALGYLLAALNAWFRDTAHLLDVVLRLLMFASPIFYEASRVPEAYQAIYGMNPLVPLLDAYRAVLMFGTWPDWAPLIIVASTTLAVLYASVWLYTRAVSRTVDEL